MFPHPDDEAYAAGGTLALLSQKGFDLSLVCATRGERGGRRDGKAISLSDLALLRSEELEASCTALGVPELRFLDLPDGSVDEHVNASTAQRLLQALDLQSADVVVTLGWDGGYGHRDHIATTTLLHRALEFLEPGDWPAVLHAAFPRGLFSGVWRALRKMPAPGVLAELREDELGTDPADLTLRVDISTVRQQKLAAIAAHDSQLLDGDPHKFFGGQIVPRLLHEEAFVHVAGPHESLLKLGLPQVEP